MAQEFTPTGLQIISLNRYPPEGTGEHELAELPITLDGIVDDRHFGPRRFVPIAESCAQDPVQLVGATVDNRRQISLVDYHALQLITKACVPSSITREISSQLRLDAPLFMGRVLIANLVVKHDLPGDQLNRNLVPGALLGLVCNDEIRSVLQVSEPMNTCVKAAKRLRRALQVIDPSFADDRLEAKFVSAAATRRGWVASVYSPNTHAQSGEPSDQGLILAGSSISICPPNIIGSSPPVILGH